MKFSTRNIDGADGVCRVPVCAFYSEFFIGGKRSFPIILYIVIGWGPPSSCLYLPCPKYTTVLASPFPAGDATPAGARVELGSLGRDSGPRSVQGRGGARLGPLLGEGK